MDQDENGRRSFRFVPGPIFTQLLMADEINRASPRTQSALLQAMQEYHVTVAGRRNDLPQPFHVLATQNPLEQEGTYPLPEAQLDRFLMQVDVGYPELAAERQILLETTGVYENEARGVIDAAQLAGDPAPDPPDAGQREGGRRHPGAGPLGPPRQRQCGDRQERRLGSRPARRPVTDALRPRPRAL